MSAGTGFRKRAQVLKFTGKIAVAVLAASGLTIGAGQAHGSPLLDPPPSAEVLSEAPDIDGAVHAGTTKGTGQITEAAAREEFRYGTGVRRGSDPEVGTMNVFTPADPSGRVLTYIPPTDSLYAGDAPSRQLDRRSLSEGDVERINAALADGVTVIVPDAYGDRSPQYAGEMNGVRIVNAVEAYRNAPDHAPVTEVTCYGFSGGGIDCARVAEYRHADGRVDLVIVDSGPTDLGGFLAEPGAQNGLGWSAFVGVERSMTADQRSVLYDNLRPSAVVFTKAVSALGDAVPVPGLVSTVMTYGGVLFPLPLGAAGKSGAIDNPEVHELMTDISPGTPDQPYSGTVVFRYNDTDVYVPPQVHSAPLAQRYRDQGSDVVVVTNHGAMTPGHEMMGSDELVGYLNGDIPADGARTDSEPLTAEQRQEDGVMTALYDGIAAHGENLTRLSGPILDDLDRVVVAVDEGIDRLTGHRGPSTPGSRHR